MKSLLTAVLFCFSSVSFAGVVASMPNQAGGKIVLTDEACVYKGKNYANLYKAYFYIPSGTTGDGCWTIEDGSDTVTVVWHDNGDTKRYPASSFNIRKK